MNFKIMDISIEIRDDKCVKCLKCVQVCPAHIFVSGKGSLRLDNIGSCIGCGHCAAVCESGAVNHSLFPPEKIHPVDYSKMATPEQVMLLLRARRTNRAFSKEPVPREAIMQILEATHRAPTASNLQQVEFTVITCPEEVKRIQRFVIDVFGRIVKKLENPLLKPIIKMVMGGDVFRYVPMYYKMKEAYESGKGDLILRGATTVIFIHAPKGSRFGAADCNLAYENGSLMAESLGISQLYTGFVCTAIKMGKGKLEQMLGIGSDREIMAGMGLGMAKFRYANYIDRKDIVYTID